MEKISLYNKIIKFFLLVGGIIAFSYCFFYLFNIDDVNTWVLNFGLNDPIVKTIGMALATLELHTTVKPNNPIPNNGIALFVLGTLLIIFSLPLSGVIVIIADILAEINKSREDK